MPEKKPFFSVIVPAYNSEDYLEMCLRSVMIQKFDDYELIVVCDNCQDGTSNVAARYADRVIEVEYGMDGLARNEGIDAAEGEWILFLDDDDWWLHEYVLTEIYALVNSDIGQNLDMVCFDFIWRGKGYARNIPNAMNIAVWSKAFRREFIGDTRFPAVPFTSDQPFMDELCAKKPLTIAMHELMYYYNYMREGSQTEQHERGGGD